MCLIPPHTHTKKSSCNSKRLTHFSYNILSQSLLPDYQRLLSSAPSRRLNSSKLVDNSGGYLIKYEIVVALFLYNFYSITSAVCQCHSICYIIVSLLSLLALCNGFLIYMLVFTFFCVCVHARGSLLDSSI